MNENYDIDAIELFVAEQIRAKGVSKNVFEGNRPSAVDSKIGDFIVVTVATGVRDRNTYGICGLSIQYFVKTLAGGVKNGEKMSKMYKGICKVFPIESDTYDFIPTPTAVPLGLDKQGYTVKAVEIQVLIKST